MLGIGFALTVVAAALSWHFVEQPFLQRRMPWAPGLKPSASCAHELAATPATEAADAHTPAASRR